MTTVNKPPRVSLVIPVYNGADHLKECLNSIAAQTYETGTFETVVVNNGSTDGTGTIADGFARRDPRFRVRHLSFVPKADNYNRALASADPEAEFIKIVEADNWLWPEAIKQMVEVAESDPEIGLVGSYYMYGDSAIIGDLIEGKRNAYPGREILRTHLLTDKFYFGTPTVMLFRAAALRGLAFRPSFFDDIELYFEVLRKWKYGFVPQVLAFVRADNGGAFTGVRDFDYIPAYRYLLTLRYGAEVLTPDELAHAKKEWRRRYLQRLAHAAIAGRPRPYWDFHRTVFQLLGEKFNYRKLIHPLGAVLSDMALNPKATVEGLRRRKRRRARNF